MGVNGSMELPPLKTLPAFIAVADSLSFSRASEALHLTHSAISQQIKQLEAALGVQLFDRNNRQVQLTLAGQRFYDSIHPALQRIEEATLQQRGLLSDRVLTVNVMMTLTMHWLIPRLGSFQKQYPGIDLRIATLTRLVDFAHDAVDMAIVYGHRDDWSNLEAQKLFDDQLLLVGSSKLAIEGMELQAVLSEYKCIYTDNVLRRHDWGIWCKVAGIKEPRRSERLYFQSSSQALQAVLSGLGVMVSHKPFIADDLAAQQLCQVSSLEVPVDKGYYAVYPSRLQGDDKLHCFLEWLSEQSTKPF